MRVLYEIEREQSKLTLEETLVDDTSVFLGNYHIEFIADIVDSPEN